MLDKELRSRQKAGAMKSKIRLLPFLGVILLSTVTFNIVSATTIYPTNNGFEQPDLGSGALAFKYSPSSPGWTFTGGISGVFGAGIAANGSNFNVTSATNGNKDNAATSSEGQAAFLQKGDGTLSGGSFSQMLTLPAGSWVLFFTLEGRPPVDGTQGANGVNVFLDGVQVGGTLFPANVGSFNDTNVNLGKLAAGSHTIAFAGNDVLGGDRTTFVDNVSFSTVPDSVSTLALMLGSVGVLCVLERFLPRLNSVR
jgi:hypothetical protein